MGLIRISDDAEEKIKELAERSGRTVTSTVDTMLQSNDIALRLDNMGKWLSKRFEELEKLGAQILTEELDTKSEVIVTSKATPQQTNTPTTTAPQFSHTPIPWANVSDIMFELLPDGAPEWVKGREEEARASNDMDFGQYYYDGETIYSDDAWGKKEWLKVSPVIKKYLCDKKLI